MRWKSGEVVKAFPDNHQFGTKEDPAFGLFYQIGITDKTLQEVNGYLSRWRHEPTIEQVSNQGNRRLLEVTSTMVSASGLNQFTQADVDELAANINFRYPTANAEYVSHTQNSFRVGITVPIAARDELIEIINKYVRNIQYANRRWYITQAGMAFLSNNGGTVSGTASQVAGYLRDGLLD
jgi:hypothetical protein